jgi:3-phytase
MKYSLLVGATAMLFAACGSSPVIESSQSAVVAAFAETTPTTMDGAVDPAIWVNRENTGQSLIVASDEEGGIEIYDLRGERIARISDRPVTLVDIHYGFPLGSESVDIAIAYDIADSALVVYAIDSQGLREISFQPFPTETEIGGLCIYRSPLSNKYYVFAVAEAGVIQQWELIDRSGMVDARLVRSIPAGFDAGHCVAHDSGSAVYFSQETVGIWRLNAEPESDAQTTPVDIVSPLGNLSGDVKGLAILEHDDGSGYLIASDAGVNLFQVYNLDDGGHAGTFAVQSAGNIDAVEETEGIASAPIGGLSGGALVVVADDSNDGSPTNYKLVDWASVVSELGLRAGRPRDPTNPDKSTATVVSASVETEPVRTYGDAADDPAIWVHPTDPSQSLIIGTQKKRGINIYDLTGKELQSLPDGRMNNADIRYGFDLGGTTVDVLTASNRSNDSIAIYAIDPASRSLRNIAVEAIDSGMSDPYGQCMYRNADSGDIFVIVNDSSGLVRQWRLEASSGEYVTATVVREFKLDSQTEGCVADDETGALYIGQEDFGIWKYSADPEAGDERVLVDTVDGGNLTADVEGMAIYYGPGETGYLVVSNQGADNFAVYRRDGDNDFIGHFHIVANELLGIDGVSETDGIDVTSASLGAAFPGGVFVAQDGRNITPDERQNFKLVPWKRIAEAMGLEIHQGYNPRIDHEQQ